MTGKEAPNKRNMQKFVRYAEGAKMYSMGLSKFQELAKDAKACYKVGQLVLVNTEILDEYLETFRIVEDDFYNDSSQTENGTECGPDSGVGSGKNRAAGKA